jgi:hypothetical protein
VIRLSCIAIYRNTLLPYRDTPRFFLNICEGLHRVSFISFCGLPCSNPIYRRRMLHLYWKNLTFVFSRWWYFYIFFSLLNAVVAIPFLLFMSSTFTHHCPKVNTSVYLFNVFSSFDNSCSFLLICWHMFVLYTLLRKCECWVAVDPLSKVDFVLFLSPSKIGTMCNQPMVSGEVVHHISKVSYYSLRGILESGCPSVCLSVRL